MTTTIEKRVLLNALEQIRTGAWSTHEEAVHAELRRAKLIRTNRSGWYDLTPAGREFLAAGDRALSSYQREEGH